MAIINQLPDLKVCSYSSFAKSYNCTIDELIELFESDLGAISRNPKAKRFIIYYNDTKDNHGLERFTIAHELGHYFLSHFTLVTGDILNRGGFTPKQYEAIEKEANCFARNLLSPVPLYKSIPIDPLSFTWKVMDTFNISYEAAIARQKFLRLDNYRITREHIKYFSTYEMPYYECCNQCKHPEIKESTYCSICGKYITEENPYFKVTYVLERSEYMIYDGVEVDKNSKVLICPNCNNEEPEVGEYCSICGTYLVNKCTNVMGPWRNEHDGPPCGELLSGNARYCTHCGAESTFLQNGILTSWENVKALEEIESFEHPFEMAEIPF